MFTNLRLKNHTIILVPLCVVLIIFFFNKNDVKDTKVKTFHTFNIDEEVCANSFRNIYTYKSSKWNLNQEVCGGCFNFIKSRLKTPFGILPIYVHNPDHDRFVSRDIILKGFFDREKLGRLIKILETDPSINFIDIGANLGVFTLSIAKFGRKVLAIEALRPNLQHLCHSVKRSGFEDDVTIVHNAAADKSGLTVKMAVDKDNYGGTFVDFDSKNIRQYKRLEGKYDQISTFQLDNLLELKEIKEFMKVVIKIDVEGFEDKVLLGAPKFFQTIDVKAVYMEWGYHRKSESGKRIIEFLSNQRFDPFTEDGEHRLRILDHEKWPWDVLWLPSN